MYYLMDLTVTMEHDVTAMAALGKELTALLETLTQHFKVAFGYYSDKVAMPFSKMTKELLENPCSDSGKECEKGFDFVHSLNFTNNVDEFIEKVRDGNLVYFPIRNLNYLFRFMSFVGRVLRMCSFFRSTRVKRLRIWTIWKAGWMRFIRSFCAKNTWSGERIRGKLLWSRPMGFCILLETASWRGPWKGTLWSVFWTRTGCIVGPWLTIIRLWRKFIVD